MSTEPVRPTKFYGSNDMRWIFPFMEQFTRGRTSGGPCDHGGKRNDIGDQLETETVPF